MAKRIGLNDGYCCLFGAVVVFLVCFLVFSSPDDLRSRVSIWTHWTGSSCCKFPDFNHYDHFTHTLSDKEFPTNDKNRRIIAIGDLHGMNRSLTALLDQLSYDAQKDTLIHLGDLVTKAPVEDSLAILSFMASNKVLGVRGNNDQDVLKWRSWMNWIISQPGGKKWLEEVDKHWSDHEATTKTTNSWPWLKKPDWGSKVPEGWKPLGQHYRVARAMSHEHFEYLRSLPLVLHAPAGHVFFVHAGLLAADPSRKPTHRKQPLSHWPIMSQYKQDIPALREAQEVALLSSVPQNQDPWVIQNMRSVRSNGKVLRSNTQGTPFPNLWNGIMSQCSGLDTSEAEPPLKGSQENIAHLPCYPSTVVYGHAAARGLDVQRWSIGLDSGCCYGRRLSALVLDTSSFPSGDTELHDTLDLPHGATANRYDAEFPGSLRLDREPLSYISPETTDRSSSRRIRFGHAGEAHIVSVQCR